MTKKELQELLDLMEAMRKKLKGDMKASRQFLVDAGIFTDKGNLRKPYRRGSSCPGN